MSQMEMIQRDIQKTSDDMPVVQLVDAVFKQAVAKKASDIHIEPFSDHMEIRFRIDGVLKPVMTIPKDFESAITFTHQSHGDSGHHGDTPAPRRPRDDGSQRAPRRSPYFDTPHHSRRKDRYPNSG